MHTLTHAPAGTLRVNSVALCIHLMTLRMKPLLLSALVLLSGCAVSPRAPLAPEPTFQAYIQADCLIWAPVMRMNYCGRL